MLSMVRIWNAPLSSSCLLNELNPVRFPVTTFTWTQPTKGDALPKMEEPGQHPRFSDVDVQAINMEGDIVGNGTSDYWVNRKELLAVVIPNPANLHFYRYHSRLDVKIDGDSETYYAYVILKDHEEPMSTAGYSVSPFQFQWENVYGYWRKLSNNAVAFI
jgi:hypothetical protein